MFVEDQDLLEGDIEAEADLPEEVIARARISEKVDVLVVNREVTSREIVLRIEEAQDPHSEEEIEIRITEEEKKAEATLLQRAETEMIKEARLKVAAEVLQAEERVTVQDVMRGIKDVNHLNKIEMTNKIFTKIHQCQ